MKIKEILTKMDEFNKIATLFEREKIHAYIEFDNYTSTSCDTASQFYRYIRSEWTNEFAGCLYLTDFTKTKVMPQETLFEGHFVVGNEYAEEYNVKIFITRGSSI